MRTRKYLIEEYPELCKEWDYKKNGDLKPENVTSGSGKKVWWICKECGHKWDATIASRTTNNNGCPGCYGRDVTDKNRLSIKFPELCEEWDYKNNDELTPENVSFGSDKVARWICKICEHKWSAVVKNRTCYKRGCPNCGGKVVNEKNCLATNYPELCKKWHPTKNGDLKPQDVTSHSDKKVWWLCPNCGDESNVPIFYKTNSDKCHNCYKIKNCFATLFPEIAKEWHPTKNCNLTPFDITYGSGKIVWWLCLACGNEWQSPIDRRTGKNKGGCANCARTISKAGSKWLDKKGVPNTKENREVTIKIGQRRYKVDGYIPETKTVYEYLGKFWHGYPEIYDFNKIHPIKGITYGELYEKTMSRIKDLENAGYTVVYVWGD